MDLFVSRRREVWQARFGARVFQCAVGRSGVAMNKREGDGATPIGCFTLRYLLFRPDRRDPPETNGLPVRALVPQLGWCDDPSDRAYNQAVNLPYPGHTEAMWREDGLYDLLAILGYNDNPVIAGRGSAIFLHLARPGYPPTEGCIALNEPDFLAVAVTATGRSRVCVLAD
jgi:L,D-peptidoglycan transpeptidase YkuD (ErfK/YbiS/YcfS/YnhG family)